MMLASNDRDQVQSNRLSNSAELALLSRWKASFILTTPSLSWTLIVELSVLLAPHLCNTARVVRMPLKPIA